MRKQLVTMMALVLTIGAQGQVEMVDTARFVAVYDYECRTLDDEGVDVADRAKVVVQVGRTVTKSMPGSAYPKTDAPSIADMAAIYQESLMHIPTVWTGFPDGKTTVREFIFPHGYEGREATPEIAWTLTEDTVSIGGFLCQQATTKFRGVEWHVWYTEEVPSSAGPWRLCGLPGLIVRATSEAHTFSLAELKEDTTAITYEKAPDVQRMGYEKLLGYKNKTFGNRQYQKNPLYYLPDFQHYITHMEVYKNAGQGFVFANGHPLLTKAHVYQPLEKE